MKTIPLLLAALLIIPSTSFAQQKRVGLKPTTKDGFYIGAAHETRNQYFYDAVPVPGRVGTYEDFSDFGLYAGYRKNNWAVEAYSSRGSKYGFSIDSKELDVIKFFPMTRELDLFIKGGARQMTYSIDYEGTRYSDNVSSAIFGGGFDYALTRHFHLRFSADYQQKVTYNKGGSVYRLGGYYKF